MSHVTVNDISFLLLKIVKNRKLIANNLDSFDEFLGVKGLKKIICDIFMVTDTINYDGVADKHTYKGEQLSKITYVLNFVNVRFDSPIYIDQVTNETYTMTPAIARKNNLTYNSRIVIDCKLNITYHYMKGNISEQVIDINDLYIGNYPIMVKSDLCCLKKSIFNELYFTHKEDPNEEGGYFIINGNEWVVEILESILFNDLRIYNNAYSNEVTRGEFISKPGDGFEISKEIIIRLLVDNLLTVQLVGNHDINEEYQIPFYLLFKLYGVMSDKEIYEYILYDIDDNSHVEALKNIITLSYITPDKTTKFSGLKYIYNQDVLTETFGNIIFKHNKYIDDMGKSVLNLLDKSLLIHIGDDPSIITRKKKLLYLGVLIKKLIYVHLGIVAQTDRDSYSTKRLHAAGTSYSKTFKTTFRVSVVTPIKMAIKNALTNNIEIGNINFVNLLTRNSKITKLAENVEKAIKTGNKEIIYDGVTYIKNRLSSQMLYRKNSLNILATLRSVHTQNSSGSNQTNRAIEMRMVHPTYLGYICPIATADTGEKVGLSKQLAISAIISTSMESEVIKNFIKDKIITLDSIIEKGNLNILKDNTFVYINGDLQGCVIETKEFLKYLKTSRLKNDIHKYTTIHFKNQLDEIHIWVDYGRILRPLIKVYNNIEEINNHVKNVSKDNIPKFKQYIKLTKEHIEKLKNNTMNIKELEEQNIIEYISAEEQENCYLAGDVDRLYEHTNDITNQYTHVDFGGMSTLGITALTSPFLNHTMPQRGSYQTNQAKQSCGWFSIIPEERFDKRKFYQSQNDYPIVSTITSNLIYPNGRNLIVAMCCWQYNQEDSLIFNRSSIEAADIFSGYSYSYVYVKINDQSNEFIRPITNENIIKTNANYNYLDERGIIKIGSVIGNNTVLVCKIVLTNKKENKFLDRSEIYNTIEDNDAYIDDIDVVYYNTHGQIDSVKIRLKTFRRIIQGDKISTRSGNKNIVSKILDTSDMPYTVSGIIPDIIVNPQGIPTRMNGGQLLESLFSKLAINRGDYIDGTAFTKFNVDDMLKELEEQYGIKHGGFEKMICGETGHVINAMIFITPLYIQHIMKFAIEELYYIDHNGGPVDDVTHQPREGKSNNGGLRMGEMEKDALSAQGATNTITEKFLVSSDYTTLYYCKTCGFRAIYNEEYDLKICKLCDSNSNIVKVNSTYVTNVFTEYLNMLGIDIRMNFKK